MNCLSYPTAFRPPGWVYQVSKKDGSVTTFVDFSSTPGVRVVEATFVDITANRTNTANASVIASLLGLPLKASANANHVYTVSQTYSDATRTDMDQPSDESLHEAFYQSPQLANEVKTGAARDYTYYLVRNAIKAKQVTYSFDKDIGADIDVGVTLKVGSIEAKAGSDDKSGLKYSKTFNDPQEVCIQVDELSVQVPKVAGGVVAAATKWSGPGDAPLFKPSK